MAALTLAALAYASNWVIARGLIHAVPPMAMAFWRWSIALVALLALAAPHLRADWPRIREALPRLAVLGVLGTGGFQVLAYWGLQHTTATNAVLLNAAVPLFVMLLAAARLGERLSARQWFGALVSAIGVVVIVLRADPAALASLAFNSGDLFVLGAMLSWAAYTVGVRRRPAGLHPASFLAVLAAAGTAFTALFFAIELAAGARAIVSAATVSALVYLGLVPSVLAYFCWGYGVERLGPSRAGLFSHLVPLFGAALSMIFLGERLHAYHLAGAALIFAGLALASRR